MFSNQTNGNIDWNHVFQRALVFSSLTCWGQYLANFIQLHWAMVSQARMQVFVFVGFVAVKVKCQWQVPGLFMLISKLEISSDLVWLFIVSFHNEKIPRYSLMMICSRLISISKLTLTCRPFHERKCKQSCGRLRFASGSSISLIKNLQLSKHFAMFGVNDKWRWKQCIIKSNMFMSLTKNEMIMFWSLA